MSLLKLLSKKLNRTLFTTPTHGQSAPSFLNIQNLKSFYKWDYSEIEGYDNLLNPTGPILMAEGKASDIYNTKKTFFLTQGSTTGLLAIMKTVLGQNDRVLVARNCHKSVFSGLVLTGADIDWFMPDTKSEMCTKWGIMGCIDPKELQDTFKLNQYKAFIMTSPTYEGINSNIEEISKVCKNYGVILIVDEAHGALYNFSEFFPKTAIEQGADFSVNSLHKNAGGLNQCALLHMSKDCPYDWREVQNSINLFHTSSPSYPLIAGIEANINFLVSDRGTKAIDDLVLNILRFQKELKEEGYEFLNEECADVTKLVLRLNGADCSKLSDILYEDYKIEDEISSEFSCLYLTGIGTTGKKLDKLKRALIDVKNKKFDKILMDEINIPVFQPYPLVKIKPQEAFNREYAHVSKENAPLMLSSEMIVPYPPGIGVLYPGEAIQKEHLIYLNDDVGVIKI